MDVSDVLFQSVEIWRLLTTKIANIFELFGAVVFHMTIVAFDIWKLLCKSCFFWCNTILYLLRNVHKFHNEYGLLLFLCVFFCALRWRFWFGMFLSKFRKFRCGYWSECSLSETWKWGLWYDKVRMNGIKSHLPRWCFRRAWLTNFLPQNSTGHSKVGSTLSKMWTDSRWFRTWNFLEKDFGQWAHCCK